MIFKLRAWGVIGLAVILLFALLFRLDSVPPLWWDEGWTLSVARNWVELGHYGRLLNGELAPRGLEAWFPVTASIAFSFSLFGAGVYQARLVAVVYTLVALAVLFALARRFYSRPIGLATLAAVICLGGRVDINPLIVGRQVLAEIPALFFLLGGYLCFLSAEKRFFLFMPPAICLWSLALFTKPQLRPFWIAALSFTLVIALLRGQWRSAKLFGTGLVGSLVFYLGIQYLFARFAPFYPLPGLTQIVAMVLAKETRLSVLIETLQFGMPTLLGLCWGVWSFFKNKDPLQSYTELVRFSFLVLVGSWFAWYVILSIGWQRYMFPPVFLGSVFVAAMLDDWTRHFSLSYTMERAGTALKNFRLHRQDLSALLATVLIAISLGQTSKILYGAYAIESDSSIEDTIHFLNTSTPADSLIETFESELFFLLDRRYHYPPDQVHVDLIRRMYFDNALRIDYDPLEANPDYLVVGHQSRYWVLYDPYLTTGAFRLLLKYPRYDIYERVR